MSVVTRQIIDRSEWLSWRQANLNASEIPALFGIHPFMTLAKLVAIKRGLDTDNPESPLLRRGLALEPAAGDEARKLHPDWTIHKSNVYYSDAALRLGATPDFVAGDPARLGLGIIQTKVVSRPIFARYWQDVPPLYVLLQAACEMLLTDSAWGAVVALEIGDFTWRAHSFALDRDRKAEAKLIEGAADFWRTMDAGDEPAIDYARDGKLIELMYPAEIKGKIVDLSTDNRIRDLLEARETLRRDCAELEANLDQVENEIKAKIGDAEGAIAPGWRMTHRTTNVKGYWQGPKSYRVLRAKRLEGLEQHGKTSD